MSCENESLVQILQAVVAAAGDPEWLVRPASIEDAAVWFGLGSAESALRYFRQNDVPLITDASGEVRTLPGWILGRLLAQLIRDLPESPHGLNMAVALRRDAEEGVLQSGDGGRQG